MVAAKQDKARAAAANHTELVETLLRGYGIGGFLCALAY